MPTYASFEGPGPSYLTPGKLYKVLLNRYNPTRGDHGGFDIADDNGDGQFCLWHGCAHIDGDWIRHVVPDEVSKPEHADAPRVIMPEPDRDTHIAATSDEFTLRRAANGGWVLDDPLDDTIIAAFTSTDDLLAGLARLFGS